MLIQKIRALPKPYIIAELGSNYKTEEQMIDAVRVAKGCGANAIKYQWFNKEELYGPAEINVNHPFEHIRAKCNQHGIDLICSTFSPKAMVMLDPYLDAHKVASCEMAHVRLLEVANQSGKTVILSTGAYSLKDVCRAMEYLTTQRTILLHCNVAYPAKFCEYSKFANLKAIHSYVGFSDHTTSIDIVPQFFAHKGAMVIEKHFNPFNLTDTPDAPHSLNENEFKAMVQGLKGYDGYTEENIAKTNWIRRVMAIKDIKAGDILKEGENIGIYRPKSFDIAGAIPFMIDLMNGCKSKVDIKEGTGVALDYVCRS